MVVLIIGGVVTPVLQLGWVDIDLIDSDVIMSIYRERAKRVSFILSISSIRDPARPLACLRWL
jgi:hypothetical protein